MGNYKEVNTIKEIELSLKTKDKHFLIDLLQNNNIWDEVINIGLSYMFFKLPYIYNKVLIMDYKKIYESIIDRAKNRELNSYKEKHHIIPKCIGGTNDVTNLVELTAKEHFVCHLLLCEIYPNENTLKSARWAMTCFKSKNHNRKYIVSSSQYDRIKNEMALLKKGVKRSDEVKKKISNSHKGKHISEETKKKISEKMKGRVQSEEHKLNQSLSKKGQIPWNKGKRMT